MAVSLGLALLCAGAPPAFAATNPGTFDGVRIFEPPLGSVWVIE